MKITHAIIRNGIARGIPEGTKVPEKPADPQLCECGVERMESGKCHKICDANHESYIDEYKSDLQALWDSSVEWEDQIAACKALPDEAFTMNEGETMDGIYPIEGVNAEIVWQSQIIGFIGWQDCGTDPIHMDTSQEYRRVLRKNYLTMKEQKQSIFERKERLAQDIYDMLVQLRKLDPEDIDIESCVRDMDYYCRVSIKNSILKK